MKRQTILLGVSFFVLLALAGFYIGFVIDQPVNDREQTKFSSDMNVTVNSDTERATVELDDESFDLMHEDGQRARFYIDLDRDGSFDIELDSLNHDGAIYNVTRAIGVGNSTYKTFIQYRDDSELENDGWLTVYRVEEQ